MDPIANLIISIKNSQMAGKDAVSVPYSNIKFQIAELLSKKGFVGAVSKKGKKNKFIEINLLYSGNEPAVHDVKRVSKSSRRIYKKAKEIFPYKSGLGMSVLSTPKGILPDMEAKKAKLGGEVLFNIW